jgi:hypothetical protein
MAKRLDFSPISRPKQTFADDDLGETDTLYWEMKRQHRAAIQRNYPDLAPAAIEKRLRKRMACGYRPYRPT